MSLLMHICVNFELFVVKGIVHPEKYVSLYDPKTSCLQNAQATLFYTNECKWGEMTKNFQKCIKSYRLVHYI